MVSTGPLEYLNHRIHAPGMDVDCGVTVASGVGCSTGARRRCPGGIEPCMWVGALVAHHPQHVLKRHFPALSRLGLRFLRNSVESADWSAGPLTLPALAHL